MRTIVALGWFFTLMCLNASFVWHLVYYCNNYASINEAGCFSPFGRALLLIVHGLACLALYHEGRPDNK